MPEKAIKEGEDVSCDWTGSGHGILGFEGATSYSSQGQNDGTYYVTLLALPKRDT